MGVPITATLVAVRHYGCAKAVQLLRSRLLSVRARFWTCPCRPVGRVCHLPTTRRQGEFASLVYVDQSLIHCMPKQPVYATAIDSTHDSCKVFQRRQSHRTQFIVAKISRGPSRKVFELRGDVRQRRGHQLVEVCTRHKKPLFSVVLSLAYCVTQPGISILHTGKPTRQHGQSRSGHFELSAARAGKPPSLTMVALAVKGGFALAHRTGLFLHPFVSCLARAPWVGCLRTMEVTDSLVWRVLVRFLELYPTVSYRVSQVFSIPGKLWCQSLALVRDLCREENPRCRRTVLRTRKTPTGAGSRPCRVVAPAPFRSAERAPPGDGTARRRAGPHTGTRPGPPGCASAPGAGE